MTRPRRVYGEVKFVKKTVNYKFALIKRLRQLMYSICTHCSQLVATPQIHNLAYNVASHSTTACPTKIKTVSNWYHFADQTKIFGLLKPFVEPG